MHSFKRFIKAQSVGAFLIHGSPEYGQRWLLNRLMIQYVRYGTIGKVVRVDLDRIARRRDVSTLWRELGGRVGLTGKQHSPTEIAERVYKSWQTQHVILVFHGVDCMPESGLNEFVDSFWLPLASRVRESLSEAHNFQLLMFLMDYEGCVGTRDISFAEKLESTWEPRIPIKLPTITQFSERDLSDWIETIETEVDLSPLEAMNRMDDPVQVILENSDNGIPELALVEICVLCGCNWYDEQERWLKL